MPGIPTTVTLNVPPLSDADFWFLNAAAWSNYWIGMTAEATVGPIVTNVYTPVPFDNTLPVYDFIVDGVDKNIPSLALFNSLVTQVATLETAFIDLKTRFINAGLITN